MKTVLIIGMGRFGHHLSRKMKELGNEIMIVDKEEEAVADLVNDFANIRIGDCINVEVLKSLGVTNYDICFVCIGTNFQSSLEITDLLKELGARYVISQATRDIHAKLLLKNGADEVIYPNRDSAEKLAIRVSGDYLYDYIGLDDDHGILEIPVPAKWVGTSIGETNVRARYNIYIIGIRQGQKTDFMPGVNYVFTGQEHLLVLGRHEDVERLFKRK